ncbi:hypothetical protein IEQ34_014268 [Dendrobium chrysotoxum]|uniref:Uncharacterized protein n=1 Tax=Dendrobium chrysotoxum TaxID=161865 RepID=A0AAV7GIJ2_DENCH|nr:hypothetical protein IEQ34_014268 [Dendrobium chrysotoxum]
MIWRSIWKRLFSIFVTIRRMEIAGFQRLRTALYLRKAKLPTIATTIEFRTRHLSELTELCERRVPGLWILKSNVQEEIYEFDLMMNY